MTDADRILALSALLEGTGIGLLELTTPEGTVRLCRGTAAAPAAPPPEASATDVRSPCAGLFRIAHPSLQDALARPGRRVIAGEAVGLVEVGSLLLHVMAPLDGTLLELLAADGDLVGYGTPLLRMTEDPG